MSSSGEPATVRVRRAQPEAEYSLQFTPATLGALRVALTASSGVAPDQQRLIFHGRELVEAPDTTLASLGVANDAVVHLVTRAVVPPPSAAPVADTPDASQQQQQQQRGTQAGFGAALTQAIMGEIFNQIGARLGGSTLPVNPTGMHGTVVGPHPQQVQQQQMPDLVEVLAPLNAVQTFAQRVNASLSATSLVVSGEATAPAHAATGGASDVAGGRPVVHNSVQCDGCGVAPIRQRRFKSLSRADYDLCETCCVSGHFSTHGPFTCLEQPIPVLVVADAPGMQTAMQAQTGAPAPPPPPQQPRFPAPPADTPQRIAQLADSLELAGSLLHDAEPMLSRLVAALRVQAELTQTQARAEAQAVALHTAAQLLSIGALSLELARLVGGTSFGQSPQEMALWQRGPVVFISPDGVQPSGAATPVFPPGMNVAGAVPAMGHQFPLPVAGGGALPPHVMGMMAHRQQQLMNAAMAQQQQQQQLHYQQAAAAAAAQQPQGVPPSMPVPPLPPPPPAGLSIENFLNVTMQQQMQQQQQDAQQQPIGSVPEMLIQVGVGNFMPPPPPPSGGAVQPQQGVAPQGPGNGGGTDANVTSISIPLPLGAVVQGVLQSLSAPGVASGGTGGIVRSAVQGALQALQQQMSPPVEDAVQGMSAAPPPPPPQPVPAETQTAAPQASAALAAALFPTPPPASPQAEPLAASSSPPPQRSTSSDRSRRAGRSAFDLTRAFGANAGPASGTGAQRGSSTSPPPLEPQEGAPPARAAPSTPVLVPPVETIATASSAPPPAGLGSMLPPPTRRGSRRSSNASGNAAVPPPSPLPGSSSAPADVGRTPQRAPRAGSNQAQAPMMQPSGSLGAMMAEMASSPGFQQFASQMLGSMASGGGGSDGGGGVRGEADLGSLVNLALGALGGGDVGGVSGAGPQQRQRRRQVVPEAPWLEELSAEEGRHWAEIIAADTAVMDAQSGGQPRTPSTAYAAFAGLRRGSTD